MEENDILLKWMQKLENDTLSAEKSIGKISEDIDASAKEILQEFQ